MQTLNTAGYFGVAITLVANTPTNIKAAVDLVLVSRNMVSRPAAREVNFQSYGGDASGSGANVANIQIGDSFLDDSPIMAGYVIPPGGSRLYRGNSNVVDFGAFFALSTGTNQILLVDCEPF